MTSNSQIFALSVSLLAAVALGCSAILPCDNQVNLPPAIEAVVNPKPVQRNFLQNNSSHKILIAVVDTGIDYNHTGLLDNIHFSLDINHQPFRLGWDFIGQDGWPCPYIGRRTAISDFELDLIDKLIEEDDQLGIYLDKKRNIVQEYLASVWHGTSMAGLIVKDSKYIGLLAYRVVPPNIYSHADQDYAIQIIENILNACRQAIEDAASIIVMTSFFHFDKNDSPQNLSSIKKLKEKFEKLMKSHPDVLFIVSAGNGHGYKYTGRDLSQIDFPAGIIAENLLVVGSISEKGDISAFSNIPLSNIRAVYFPGQNKECIFPQNMLSIPQEYLTTLPTLLDDILEGNESVKSVASYLRLFGRERQLINDGTSFSTAIAANACAKLWVGNIKPAPTDIINELITRSDTRLRVSY